MPGICSDLSLNISERESERDVYSDAYSYKELS